MWSPPSSHRNLAATSACRYFSAKGSLPATYWLGAARDPDQSPGYLWADVGAEIPGAPQEELPYSHWAWTQAKASAPAAANCATAVKDLAYELFAGDATSEAQLANSSLYALGLTTRERRYGWQATNCVLRCAGYGAGHRECEARSTPACPFPHG